MCFPGELYNLCRGNRKPKSNFMKIYTKKGDKGTTSLLGGKKVPKHHLRIEAYGTVDELNSHIGLLRDQVNNAHHFNILLGIQERLFTLGSTLALDPSHAGKMELPTLKGSDVELLETEMDEMETHLPEMKHFVLPGGHITVSQCHVVRCVCRRAERCATALATEEEVPELTIRYLNRLSDYFFVLARKLTMELKAEEIPWIPKK